MAGNLTANPKNHKSLNDDELEKEAKSWGKVSAVVFVLILLSLAYSLYAWRETNRLSDMQTFVEQKPTQAQTFQQN